MRDLQQKIEFAQDLIAQLAASKSLEEKVSHLFETPVIKSFSNDIFKQWIEKFSLQQKYLLLCPIALGQGAFLYGTFKEDPLELLETLESIERFYETIGGIIGYHLAVLQLLVNNKEEKKEQYLQPVKIDIHEANAEVHEAIRAGIEQFPLLAELYPVGGAGDRLALMCPEELEPLPAAQLPFCGKTLLEGLFRDLQAREYLYFKLTGKQLTTPVALMTSHEKANDTRIAKILFDNQYFGRPIDSIKLFKQPMVPLITEDGDWVIARPMHPQLKPGGHGAVWRLAISEGIFDWFKSQGRTKGLVRQINNPVAGIDYGLLAFTGIGLKNNKSFGFAACPRVVNNAEGTDVLVETHDKEGYIYTLSNIEYTEFDRKGIEDRPIEDGSLYSSFPANTNILFFDIDAIRKAVEVNPIPGMILNMKTKMDMGNKEVCVGRLESTMQNISDVIATHFKAKPSEEQIRSMPVYLTYNKRRKTLSVAKNAYDPQKSSQGTPEGCFYEWLENMVELLKDHCGMTIPSLCDLRTYLHVGPNLNIYYHPALGPLFEIIAKKIQGGSMNAGSELILNIAELEMRNVTINGSLVITADRIMGHRKNKGLLEYSHNSGKCTLINCQVLNKGIDREATKEYWNQSIVRNEVLDIRLQGNAEFFAEDVCFRRNVKIVVPDGYRMVATEHNDDIDITMKSLTEPTWSWKYSFSADQKISLHIDQQKGTLRS